MARLVRGLLLGGLMVLALGGVHGQADGKLTPGIYKVTLLGTGQQSTFWLLKLDDKDGKWTGETIAASAESRIPKAGVSDISVKDGVLHITFKLEARKFPFEGKIDGGKKVLGSLHLDRLFPAQLELTGLKSLDLYEYAKDTLAQSSGPEVVDAAITLLKQATDKKAKIEDVRAWAAKAVKSAESYGPRYQLDTAIKVADLLAAQDDYSAVALQYARQAERLLTPGEKPTMQRRVLSLLAGILKKAGKDEDAKEVEARIGKIDMVAVTKYAGRKKGDQNVLVELFTGAECPPCVAADVAFDALGKTYKPKDVILLQYHLHIPRPDPLTNSDAEARARYYNDEIEGTPTILFDGKAGGEGGGGFDQAQEKYEEYLGIIDPLLEKTAKAKLKTTATRKGDKIDISATVEVDKPSDSLKLRFALVEDSIKYTGSNKLDEHHHVVRALPGGAAGFAVKDKTLKQTATVDLAELRKQLGTYLDDFSKKNEVKWRERPIDLKSNFRVVAFVQNDATKEVLQAEEIEVKAE